ncbi:MAG: hypothetical protein IT196_27070 [Acidimicrobiales bacterium]|nr:hypothetical protein [Acidimicrobiales bacterium]
MSTDISGYTYDTALATSPVSLDDLNLLLATLLWTDDDAAALARAGADHADTDHADTDHADIDHADIDAMHTAWFKAVTLTVALWSQPYDPTRW